MSFRYRITCVAATMCCLDAHMRPHVKRGPVPPPMNFIHPVEISIGTVLSLPLFPARIQERPHPLWLGLQLWPPMVDVPHPAHAELAAAGCDPVVPLRIRMPMRDFMAWAAERIGLQLGDAANALGKTVMASLAPNRFTHLLAREPAQQEIDP